MSRREHQRALLVAVAVLAAACSGGDTPSEAEATPVTAKEPQALEVETVHVDEQVLASTVAAAGSVRARRESAIGAEVSGRITAVFVDVGDEVSDGDELFRIDPVRYEIAVAESEAGLRLARAELENAEAEEARIERLVEERATSMSVRDDHKTASAVAAAQVAQMEARLAAAQADLERTVVRAPYAGSVVERRAHEGAMAGPQPVIVLQESGRLEVVLNIPEATLVPVGVGDAVSIFSAGLADPIRTEVTRVSDRVDPATRTVEVRAPVDSGAGILKAGSFVRAEVAVAPDGPRPTLPRSALLVRDGRTLVFMLEGDRVRQVTVRTGAHTEDEAEVLSGVEVGTEVARGDVLARLVDGERVRRASAPIARAAPQAER